ncbi:serine/threonine protein kinase [Loktanella sp. D2R18]|uniref:serine/threonine protein kinase n=1 Tax=Rhodobacterales TaxID=204455 RepID=UPI000DE87F9C|nr:MULTISPECIES: protein kinase [Rhodobacterales]MDO6590941.1 protein kinase [Yoonia sp. 1_MG-2023]RBW43353.1 serine/threonine protein kinase [Loktanella sp. D2R18]
MAKAQETETMDEKDSFVDELKPGTKLMHGQYTIESFLNAGGFGITYLAKDSLDRKIVIKECFPGAFCRRSRYVVQARSRAHQNELKSIVRLFVQEARSLAKLDHPNIVGVHQVFEDNDTAYMALDFVEGRDLLDTIEDSNSNLTPAQIKVILKEVLSAVGFIHEQGILHRDISPDNILINQTFHPVLIDFGAAREEATKQSRVLSALRVVKDGYSPQEFYIAGSEQSPSSDLYALAATFYHLINNDVPPNSQARLAAIASGDTDPYVKLAGRFPDYEDSFLGALDQALAVLPKDRIQSAEDWLQIIDGKQGNVTPLNAAATAAPVAEAAPAAKSKLPILLGSAAVVAILAGVGVMTMTGGDDAPVPEQETAVATPDPVVETPAPVVEAAPEVETPAPEVVDAPPEVTPPVTETVPEPAPVVVEDEPAVVAPVIVDGPVIVDTPVLRPAARPESVELAAQPEPLPEPVATPQPTATDPEASTEFAEQTGTRPVGESEIADVALPDTPEAVDTIGAGLDGAIDAVVPGNELQPSYVSSEWTVGLPFGATDDTSNVISQVGLISPLWVEPGLEITSVNGVEVDAIAGIPAALRASMDGQEVPGTISATFGTINADGVAAEHDWNLPVSQELVLSNGVSFKSVFADDAWRTTVADMPTDLAGGLQAGDVVVSYIPTAETLTERETLTNIFNRELESDVEQFMFAVQRDGSMWVASLIYTGPED